MASKKSLLGKEFAFSLFSALSMSANAQIKYNSSGRLTIGTTTPYSFYPTTHNGSIYFKDNSSHFFQIDDTCVINAVQQLSSEVEELKGKISK